MNECNHVITEINPAVFMPVGGQGIIGRGTLRGDHREDDRERGSEKRK